MKKILFLLLFVLCASFATAQQTLKFGNVTLSDTASGSLNLKSGGLYAEFFYTAGYLLLKSDSGDDIVISGTNDGLFLYMNESLMFLHPSQINVYAPFYLNQYSTAEIGGLSVNDGAMVINSDTDEVWVYLQDQWKILDTK